MSKKQIVDVLLNYPIDTIKRVHFHIVDLKRKVEYNIVNYPIVGLIKGN